MTEQGVLVLVGAVGPAAQRSPRGLGLHSFGVAVWDGVIAAVWPADDGCACVAGPAASGG